MLGNDQKSAITSARVRNESFYEESKELQFLTRCDVALRFENVLTLSRYFSELKDLSSDGLAM